MTTTLVPLKTPLSVVTSSFLAARSTASSFRLASRHECGNRRLRPAALTLVLHKCCADLGRGDALQILPPKARGEPHRVLEVRTGRGAHHPKTVFPRLCRPFDLRQ